MGPIRVKEGNLCEDEEHMGRVLNEFFVSVFTKERGDAEIVIQEEQRDILDKIITKEEVSEEFKSLKMVNWQGRIHCSLGC